MRKALILSGILVALCAFQVAAQGGAALHYDPYYVLPGSTGGIGIDAGLSTSDFGSIGDAGDVYAMAKYSISDRLEAGAHLTFGFLNDFRDSFSAITVGAKFGFSESSAATINITPLNEADEIGLSIGYMQTLAMGGMDVSSHLQVGLLDGYAPEGIEIDLFIEPRKEINKQMTGFLDVLVSTNTDGINDNLAIDLGPNLDYVVQEGLVVNAGLTFGVGGDMKQDDAGLMITAIKTMTR